MGRMSEVPTRHEVDETVEQHDKDMDEKLEELDTITEDTETVRETKNALDSIGTAEGNDAVDSTMDAAEDVTVEIFDREDSNLEDIQDESQDYQSELQERSDTSESDLGKISDASGQIETQETVDELVEAKTAVLEDIDFLSDQVEQENQSREDAEREQQHYEGRVHGGGK